MKRQTIFFLFFSDELYLAVKCCDTNKDGRRISTFFQEEKKDSRVTPPCDGTVSVQWVGPRQGQRAVLLLATRGLPPSSLHRCSSSAQTWAQFTTLVVRSASMATPTGCQATPTLPHPTYKVGGAGEDAIDSFQETKLQTLTKKT